MCDDAAFECNLTIFIFIGHHHSLQLPPASQGTSRGWGRKWLEGDLYVQPSDTEIR